MSAMTPEDQRAFVDHTLGKALTSAITCLHYLTQDSVDNLPHLETHVRSIVRGFCMAFFGKQLGLHWDEKEVVEIIKEAFNDIAPNEPEKRDAFERAALELAQSYHKKVREELPNILSNSQSYHKKVREELPNILSN